MQQDYTNFSRRTLLIAARPDGSLTFSKQICSAQPLQYFIAKQQGVYREVTAEEMFAYAARPPADTAYAARPPADTARSRRKQAMCIP